jgi:hypothetical protein
MRKRAGPRQILFIVGRDNWIKSVCMSRMFVGSLRNLGFEFMWEDPSFGWILRLQRLERFFPRMTDRTLGFHLKLLHLLYGATHRGYFRLHKLLNTNLEFRIQNLRKRLGRIRGKHEVSILSYSSGGRVSSLAADRLQVKQLVCIGYPFRNPKEGENPDRYRHLADLRTPMLIVQGNRDEYGGSEVDRTIPLSPGIELFFVDCTHAYELDSHQLNSVLSKIGSALAPQV